MRDYKICWQDFEGPPAALEALYDGLMDARQTACGRLAAATTQHPSPPHGGSPSAVAVRRHSAAVACRRYASVLVYQLLHGSGCGDVGLRFLQHAATLVALGDVADHLFVVQVGCSKTADT